MRSINELPTMAEVREKVDRKVPLTPMELFIFNCQPNAEAANLFRGALEQVLADIQVEDVPGDFFRIVPNAVGQPNVEFNQRTYTRMFALLRLMTGTGKMASVYQDLMMGNGEPSRDDVISFLADVMEGVAVLSDTYQIGFPEIAAESFDALREEAPRAFTDDAAESSSKPPVRADVDGRTEQDVMVVPPAGNNAVLHFGTTRTAVAKKRRTV